MCPLAALFANAVVQAYYQYCWSKAMNHHTECEATDIKLALKHAAYSVKIGCGLLGTIGRTVHDVAPNPRCAIISDENVASSHAAAAEQSLAQQGFSTTTLCMRADEREKSVATFERLCRELLGANIERDTPLLAIGGGITGDTAGFVAAAYRRGMPLIQCPTTLLAMVDASVGGKVAVNLSGTKNMLGAFYQPKLVVIDLDVLTTLPARQLRCGLAECLKHGIIGDVELFRWTAAHLDSLQSLQSDALHQLVKRNVAFKTAVVEEDEQERGRRALLNLGHTFGHALEALDVDKQYLHGEAVAIGVIAATFLAVEEGICDRDVLEEIESVYQRAGLPTKAPLNLNEADLLQAMKQDKKVVGNSLRLILPKRIGEAYIESGISGDAIRRAWSYVLTPKA